MIAFIPIKMTRTFLILLVFCFAMVACQPETEILLPASTATPSITLTSLTPVPHSWTATPTLAITPTPKPATTQQPSQIVEPTTITPVDSGTTVTPVLDAPFTVFVLDEAWLIEHSGGDIHLQFDSLDWSSTTLDDLTPLFYEGGPALLRHSLDQCVISLNFGGGVPFDWGLETEKIRLGDHTYSRTTYRDADGDLQFVIYDTLFRVTFSVEPDACLEAAEGVLATYQLAEASD